MDRGRQRVPYLPLWRRCSLRPVGDQRPLMEYFIGGVFGFVGACLLILGGLLLVESGNKKGNR
ncbi:hypothetical protein SEA_SENDITCS_69 [Streptomyces phage SendItCS]|nr:hypothetical protein SEA_SENDITCS_69 [Streptomyces phage SendItCS]